jgi:hypothetical protein
LGAFDIASVGYVAEEFFVSGAASSYAPAAELGPDGQWSVTPSSTADYTTRMVVLTPADRAKFNGTVIVEWLNVSGGIDAPAVWFMAHREMVRAGYAYVAVSAQRVGVEGGESLIGLDMSLKTQDPTRYASLRHPGDAFCYDIFSQIGRLVQDAERSGVLGPLKPEHVIAVGESQSALFLTTYVNAADPLAKVYDGFLVHSRFAPAAPLDGNSIFADSQPNTPQPVTFRVDLRVPLITVVTETDGQRTTADLGDPRHRSCRQLHNSSGTDRHRLCAPRRHRGSLCADQHADGPAIDALHQLRPATPLRFAGGTRGAVRVGSNGRAGAQRCTHRVERCGSAEAGFG